MSHEEWPAAPVFRDDVVDAGVRIILKRALAAIDVPIAGDEETPDLARIAARIGAPVGEKADEWVGIAMGGSLVPWDGGLRSRTFPESQLMEKQAQRALEIVRREGI